MSGPESRVAALFVETGGVYFGLDYVDPWDVTRDARLYPGDLPVVAHPPCARWSLMSLCRGYYDGKDAGCFESALRSVRAFGGVLEHPAHTLAWKTFGLPRPSERGWTATLFDDGVTCEVDQRRYGHEARKPTWLYYVGESPFELLWGVAPRGRVGLGRVPGEGVGGHRRSRTPIEFRNVLVGLAANSQGTLRNAAATENN